MSLYEIITSMVGESYVRAYAWAAGEAEARQLFEARNAKRVERGRITAVVKLFDADAAPFCTPTSDSGFEKE